ncbi:MAG TPA: PD-(D/E)XK nuclease family protein [Fimbriimonadaceae bacterium]|jgi:hypothetical protein
MGTARKRSWSFSRQRSYEYCPRRFYYDYFSWGDQDEKLVNYLRRITTPEQLAGLIVHDVLALWLQQYRQIGIAPVNLQEFALARYRRSIEQSREFVNTIKEDRRPSSSGPIFDQDLYREHYFGSLFAGQQSIIESLQNFESGSVWEAIRKTKRKREGEQLWLEVDTNLHEGRWIEADLSLGLGGADGLRIYAVFDFGLKRDGKLHLYEWKTGRITDKAKANAKQQMAVYALWGLANGYALSEIVSHIVWLGSADTHFDLEVTDRDLDEVRQLILTQDQLENSKTVHHATKKRGLNNSFYVAERDNFPQTDNLRNCARCKYRMLCGFTKAQLPHRDITLMPLAATPLSDPPSTAP